MNGKDVLQEFCDPKEWLQLAQMVSKRLVSDSSMKKKQIIVQERCLACGNGSPALPQAKVREDKEHASGPSGFRAGGESHKEGAVSAVLRPQTPTSAAADDARDVHPLPDIEKYRYRSAAKKEEVPVGSERSGRLVKFEPMQEKISNFEVQLPPRPTTQARGGAPTASPLRYSIEKNTGYRASNSPSSGAFLADMSVGLQNKGLTANDRISDFLDDADHSLLRASISSSPSSLYTDSRSLSLMASLDKQASFAKKTGSKVLSAQPNVFGGASPSDTVATVPKVVVLQGSGNAASTPHKVAKT